MTAYEEEQRLFYRQLFLYVLIFSEHNYKFYMDDIIIVYRIMIKRSYNNR